MVVVVDEIRILTCWMENQNVNRAPIQRQQAITRVDRMEFCAVKILHQHRIIIGMISKHIINNKQDTILFTKLIRFLRLVYRSAYYADRRSRNSYDIDNIVIPYSIAASTRVEVLKCKEIPTPK